MRSETGSIVRHVSVWVLLMSLVIAALLSVGGRVLVANVEYFKASIEQELSDYGITGVSLEDISGGWQGFHPLLKIKGASLSIPGRSQALSIDEMSLSVKLIPSLMQTDLILEAFNASVSKMILVHDLDGQWWLNDIPLSSQSEHRQTTINVFAFFQRLPDFVNIDIRLLQVRDQFNDIDYLVQSGQVQSSRMGEQLSLRMSAQLPATLGRRVELSAKGDASLLRVYIDAPGLDLVRLLQLTGKNQSAIRQARLSLKSWAELKNYRLSSVLNEARLSPLVLHRETVQAVPIELDFRQKLQPVESGWLVDTVVDRLTRGDHQLSTFHTQLILGHDDPAPVLWMNRLRLGELADLVSGVIPDDGIRSSLQVMQPDATIENLVARLNMQDLLSSSLGFEFSGFQTRPHEAIPGINKLSGRVFADQRNAQVQIDPEALTVTFNSLFRDPLVVEKFSSSVDITALDSGLLVSVEDINLSNADISLQGRAWLETKGGNKPFLSLRTSYKGGRAGSTGKYLPVRLMPERTVEWLDKSILGGEITQGGLLFHGRVQKLSVLEKNMSGEFHALFDVHNPDVNFLPNWPHVRKGFGLASFHNLSMDLSFTDAEFAGTLLDSVSIGIADFLEPQLKIHGSADTDSKTLMNSLQAMPVVNVIDEINQRSQRVGGSVKSVIDLTIPLARGQKKPWTLKATADLHNVDLSIPEWMVYLQKVNGRLQIDDDIIEATALKGMYGKDPVRIDVNSNKAKDTTNFRLRGKLDSARLARLLPDYLRGPIQGKSPWDIKVAVANNPAKNYPRVSMLAASQLKGTRFDMPAPLQVIDKEQLDFQFRGSLSHDLELDFSVTLADRVDVHGRLKGLDKTSTELAFLNLSFGDTARHTGQSGIRLSGIVENLDVNGWRQYEDKYLEESQDPSSLLSQIQALDLNISSLNWGGHHIEDSHVGLRNDGQKLAGEIASPVARGIVEIPYRVDAKNPLMLNLDMLKLDEPEDKHEYKIEIQDMPSISIHSKSLFYKEMEFSDFTLHTENASNTFLVRQLDLSRDDIKLESSGHWQFNEANNEHVSVFNIKIHGTEFGKTISDLGLGDSLRQGAIDLQGQIGWGGSLFDMNWPTLIGEVKLNLKKGYLNNIEPGAGRFVGLLSLSALPKRLFLDFGDVLNEGMQFDEIKGNFRIRGEVMTTQNASLKSSSAKLKLTGDTNLRQKTYDQSMIITPRVSDTLPVLGTIAAGSGVGWGLLLIQRIFKKPLEKSVEIEYKVTGSWTDPQITLVPKPQTSQEEEY